MSSLTQRCETCVSVKGLSRYKVAMRLRSNLVTLLLLGSETAGASVKACRYRMPLPLRVGLAATSTCRLGHTTTTTTTGVVAWRLAGHLGGTSRLMAKAKLAKATKAAMKKAKAMKEALMATSTVRPNSLRRLHH